MRRPGGTKSRAASYLLRLGFPACSSGTGVNQNIQGKAWSKLISTSKLVTTCSVSWPCSAALQNALVSDCEMYVYTHVLHTLHAYTA